MSLAEIAGLPLKILMRSFNYVEKISRLPYVDSEKTELRSRIRELEKMLAESEEARLEDNRLRKLLVFKQEHKEYSTPARIIGRDPNNWSSVVYIDKGKNDGIAMDM